MLRAQALREYDLVLIATNHDACDYYLILKNAELIVDARGVYREPTPNHQGLK
jgi:UDP-N-acetyl-D-glucosamine dehydrogenase